MSTPADPSPDASSSGYLNAESTSNSASNPALDKVDISGAVTPSVTPMGSNPYAPPTHDILPPSMEGEGRSALTAGFWLTVGLVTAGMGLITVTTSGMGLPFLIPILPALIRVVIIDRRLTRAAGKPLEAIPSFFLSWLLCWLMMIACAITFATTCTMAIFTSGPGSGGLPASVVFGFATLIALLAFIGLFRLSLKLSI